MASDAKNDKDRKRLDKEKVFRERSVSESKDGNCVLCCEKAKFFAVGPCDHPVCYKCSSRMRVMSKQHYCSACRAEMVQVVFCRTPKKFEEFDLKKLNVKRQHGIRFEDNELKEAFESLLDYVCSQCGDKERPFGSFQELKTHIRKAHEKQICQICSDNLSIFPREIKLYTKKELVIHRREGDKDERSHRGHPECRFCDDRFFDNDSLLLHLRKRHFWCHFCEHDGKQDYYDGYKDLRRHFASDHYLCDEGNCVNEKFTSVFRDKIDFQAHKLAAHGKKLNKMQTREARKVELDFSYTKRQQKTNVVSGNDYEEVNGATAAHAGHSSGRGSSSRYHRDHRGTLNFHDFENVENDRKEFKGRLKMREAEEVENRDVRNRVLASATSLSSSEPDIHSRARDLHLDDSDDDVIGMADHLNTRDERRAKKEQEKRVRREEEEAQKKAEEAKRKAKEKDSKRSTADTSKIGEQTSHNTDSVDGTRMKRTEEDFPTLPGSKSQPFSPALKTLTHDEAFPALGKPVSIKQTVKKKTTVADTMKSNSNKPLINQINGIPIVKSKKKGKGKSWNQQTGRAKIESSDDFPALGVSDKKNTTRPMEPTLTDTKKTKNGGLNLTPDIKLEKKKPPGLVTKKKEVQPNPTSKQDARPSNSDVRKTSAPPGFSNDTPPFSGDTPPRFKAENSLVEKTLPKSQSVPPGFKKDMEDSRPQNQMERNMRLLAMLKANLDDFNLNLFKTLSGEFRRGSKSGQEYYDAISELLGDNLKFIFSELVALLPDDSKQQELLFAHNNAKVAAKQLKETVPNNPQPDYISKSTWGATSIKTSAPKPDNIVMTKSGDCRQTFPKGKALEHMESHSESFPSLPTAVKKKKNYSFMPVNNRQVPVRNAWGK